MTTYLVTIFLCFLSFLFNFSSARIPFQIYDIIERSNTNTNTNTNPFSVSENNPTDPIDKPTTLIQWENEKTSESEPKTEPTVDPTQSSNGIPLTVVSFDPRNPRHPLPLRIRHRCHHYKPWKPSPREIVPLKNNAIIRTRGGPRHMARGWTRFGHVDPMLHRQRQRGMDMERSSELLRSHYHRRHRDDDDDEDAYEAADNKIKDTGFVKRIRKFLNQF